MKICLACNQRFSLPSWQCHSCGNVPKKMDGFLAFAPDLALKNEGFDPTYFKDLIFLEPKHFWYRSRNRLIIWALRCYFAQARSFLEIGCGSGFVLSGIERAFPMLSTWGSDIYSSALTYAAGRLGKTDLFQMDACKIPFEEEFDVIGTFDVLEHIEQDDIVLSQMYRAVRKGGGIILTVPQHPFLWSLFDEYSHHVRRYSLSELKAKIANAGFKIKRITSFVSLLLPLVLISRRKLRNPNPQYDHIVNIKIPVWQNVILEKVLDFERVLITAGVSFPVGSSLLLIAQKS